MRTRTMVARAACALVMAVTVLGCPSAAPAGANLHDYGLAFNTLSIQYQSAYPTGCLFKVIFGNYGSAPYAGVRTYGGSACTGIQVAIWSADSNGTRWTSSSTVAHTGTDGCGAYSAVQATGPNPGYGLRARVTFATGHVRHYADDGVEVQPGTAC
jgi:hypothetical protein